MKKLVVLTILLAACSTQADVEGVSGLAGSSETTTSTQVSETTIATTPPDTVAQTDSGLPVEVFTPSEPGAYPVVVTVHGGGWVSGSPDAMAPLGAALAAEGVVVFNVTYRAMEVGGRFPGMVEDVACGVAYARAHAGEFTTTPDTVTLVGFSAGAHLSALVALAPETFTCPDGGTAAPDGFIGLAGPYDVTRLPILNTLFGSTLDEDPDLWASGNPLSYPATMPDIPVLLVHGDEDTTVPLAFSTQLEEALTAAGAGVTFEVVPGGTHGDVIDPVVVAEMVRGFVD